MNILRRLKSFRLDFDRDYGFAHQTGWSVCINGTYYDALERSLIKALWRAWRGWRAAIRDMEAEAK